MKTSDKSDLQKVNKLMRNYSKNRPHISIVYLIVFSFLFFSVAGLSILIGTSNSLIITIIAVFVLICIFIGIIFFSTPEYFNRLASYLSLTIFKKEGIVNNQIRITPAKKRLSAIAAVIFGTCIFLNVLLGFFNFFDLRYAQPISAIYVVPFLLVIFYLIRPASIIIFIWPILYAAHAVLTLLKIPVFFDSRYSALNMSSIAIYGLFTFLISFIIGRITLRKLKSEMEE
jgi:hypothetical protein